MNASASLTSIVVALGISVSVITGCRTVSETESAPPDKVGFLSTYRHLEPQSDASLGYLDPTNRLARYDKFIVLPVQIRQYEASDATPEELDEIKRYMHEAVVRALSDGYQVVSSPGGDVAEVRIAVTNIQKSTPILNVIPRPKLLGLGLGTLSMESEVIDSVSNVQIAALIESRTGQNRTIDFSQLDDTKAVMDDWAQRFRVVVDEAHAAGSGD